MACSSSSRCYLKLDRNQYCRTIKETGSICYYASIRGLCPMSHLPVTINGKTFNINCSDEEKDKIIAFSDYINQKINLVAPKCKAMSEVSLLSFTLLSLADEIFSQNELIKHLESQRKENIAQISSLKSGSDAMPAEAKDDIVSDDVYAKIQDAIRDIKSMAQELEQA